jgi:hypothetical protein
MDKRQEDLSNAFTQCLDRLPTFDKIVGEVSKGFDQESPNILLYGAKGMPHVLLWDAIIEKRFGKFRRTECVWNKQWIYNETQYFFEIDLANPNQPKDIETLVDFLKEIIVHVCMHAKRHVFFLKNIDVICAKGASGTFRVLLERFSNTAWFVCSTYRLGALEQPLHSRFHNIRVSLPTNDDIRTLFHAMQIDLPETCISSNVRNIPFAMFIANVLKHEESLPYSLDVICLLNAPFLSELTKSNSSSTSIDDIRIFTQKLSTHGYTISHIVQDILSLQIIKPSKMYDFIQFATQVDHMCSLTDKYRKSLYIEWLLTVACYSNDISIPSRLHL